LRARKKVATRRALTRAAIELFGEIGYEAATVSLIAERAEVSERTFFEYFPSKEDVVLVASANDLAEFAKHVSEQPMDRPVLDILEDCFVERLRVNVDSERSHEIVQMFVRATMSSAVIRGKVVDYMNQFAQAAAEGLATRQGEASPDAAMLMLADVALLVLHHAASEWANVPDGDFENIARAKFQLFREIATEDI
jgi:AcrR family transcriptional regulator